MPGLDLTVPDWLMVGASGMVGRLVRGAWLNDPRIDVRLVSQLRSEACKTDEDALFWAPLEGPERFEQYVRSDGSPAALIMVAGVIPGPNADFTKNSDLAVACLEAAKAAGCNRVLIASSAAVYGPSLDVPFSENTPCGPVAPYGASKLAMEQACEPYRDAGMDVCCLRIGNVVGADALMRNAADGSSVQIDRFADCHGPERSYIGPESLARVLATLAGWHERLPDVLNVAAPIPTDMADLARAADLDWSWADAPDEALQRVTLDATRLGQFYEFSADECTAEGMVAQFRRSGQLL